MFSHGVPVGSFATEVEDLTIVHDSVKNCSCDYRITTHHFGPIIKTLVRGDDQ